MPGIINLLFLLFILGVRGQHNEYAEAKDIYYYNDALKDEYKSEICKLDIHYPLKGKDHPVIIWYHGGGLTGGKKEIPEALKQQGFCVVGVGYRLSPHVPAASSILDAAASIAWVYKNISKYNGSSQKIVVSGHSAGGYLALMTVMNKSYLAAYGIDANTMAGLVPFSGHTITHFTIRAERGIGEHQAVVDDFAPLYYVRNDAPPILLITGDRNKELLARYEENAYFFRMMKVAGHKDIQIFELDGYGHGMTYPAFPLLIDFIKSKIK
ncbi:alpha/beta hydrolase [Abyssalbus ytuae]|uniref:Alpha/beta hydrolase n=1 Tax=Abyssalbus ytuae TaxID=2926907 RepID=A0A9E6ZKD1_9FLAO|nr:alpha/beta hydrolase [Abyssalbus ytuae]UOB17279.1 alpha/beta hydrolase [Abyssalbus ytuae]